MAPRSLAAVLALLATTPAAAQDPGELPDVTAEAGRDLTGLHRLLNTPRTEFDPVPDEDGRAAFGRFVRGLRKALEKHPALLSEVPEKPKKWPKDVREMLVRGYLTRVHHTDLPAALGELVRMKTVSRPGGPPADDPALSELGAWLKARCERFGLGLSAVAGGRAWTVTLGKGRTRLGLVTHVDVRDATPEGWRRDPWGGKLAARRIWGRGASGGKAGLVTLLYALKVVRDSGVPLRGRAVLLVGTANQTDRAPVRAWLRKHRLPKATVVAGVPFPLSIGEKGQATVTVRATPGDEPEAAREGWKVVSIRGGGDPDRVAVEARALLDPRDLPRRRALGAARRNLTLMRGRHPDVSARFEEEGPYVAVTFSGRPGHAADPAAGHSALADLVVFLADYLGVFPDHRGRLVRFLAAHVGHETDGTRLGLRLDHPSMTPTTVNLGRVEEAKDGPRAVLDVRWPLGRKLADVKKAVRNKAREFVSTVGGSLEVSARGTDPVLADAQAPHVKTLAAAYREVLRRDPALRTLARPTYARHVKGAVAFGPAPTGTDPDPLAKDQQIGIEELDLAARLYATAILRLLAK